MDTLLNNLLEMGFDQSRAEKALKATSCAGLAEAMDWLIAHEADIDNLDPDTLKPSNSQEAPVEIIHEKLSEKVTANICASKERPAASPKTPEATPNSETSADAVAHSYRCEDCGRLLRNEQELEFHAAKSNHSHFSESTEVVKALSEEEKKTRLLQLQERLRSKREQKEAAEKKEAIDAEKNRRRTGQEILAAKQRIEEQEMKKLAEDRKRQKKEDALAKQKILDEIKRQKEARKKEANANIEEMHKPAPEKTPNLPANNIAPGNYEDCRIQIRMLNGQSLAHTFKAKEQLSAVRLYAELNRTDDVTVPFNLMTNFPRHLFSDEDMEATLESLGLVPSSVLTMTRKAAATGI